MCYSASFKVVLACPLFLFKVSICMQSPDETQLCWPSQSLWSLIAEHVPGSELPKIRGALGNSLVDMYIDLYAEVRALNGCCHSASLFFSADAMIIGG